jgi:hypothetical protein
MTRENAILCLKGIKNYGRDTFTEQSDWQESLDMAIKALEQEPVLDKIIAEIENTEIKGYIRDVECYNAGINFALHTIAKYKAESEE